MDEPPAAQHRSPDPFPTPSYTHPHHRQGPPNGAPSQRRTDLPRRRACTRGPSNTDRRALEVDPLDQAANLIRLPEQIGKVLPGDVALGPELGGVVSALAEALDRARQADAQVVGWVAERSADLGREPVGVEVRVVERGEGGAELGR